MMDFVLIAAETSASFSDVWPFIAATATAIAVPLMAVIRWQQTTYATEKADLIARWDANNIEHKKEIKEILLPAVVKMTDAIIDDVESNATLGSDLRDLKTTIDIRFGPDKPGGQ